MNPQEIIEQVARDYYVTSEGITGPSRLRCIYVARQRAVVRLRDEMGMTLEAIGLVMHRTESTIGYSYRTAVGD